MTIVSVGPEPANHPHALTVGHGPATAGGKSLDPCTFELT